MLPARQGAIRLFRLAGVDVFLHWSWFVVALYEIQVRARQYRSPLWNLVEYLTLFGIVTLHEFGHSLACRQTGGTANQIVLWPLGGLSYVNPPQRPGATLWSVAAGPLVNVLLLPVLVGLILASRASGMAAAYPDASRFLRSVSVMNLGLLIFNLFPIYPLDGGQILRSLLWFVLGRSRSLTAATIVGFLGALGLLLLAVVLRSPWIALMAVFVALRCWSGFQHARLLARVAQLPRRLGFACPSCGTAPPVGAFWACQQCRSRFDTFETGATCPSCGTPFAVTSCAECGRQSPMRAWAATPSP